MKVSDVEKHSRCLQVSKNVGSIESHLRIIATYCLSRLRMILITVCIHIVIFIFSNFHHWFKKSKYFVKGQDQPSNVQLEIQDTRTTLRGIRIQKAKLAQVELPPHRHINFSTMMKKILHPYLILTSIFISPALGFSNPSPKNAFSTRLKSSNLEGVGEPTEVNPI